MSGRIVGIDLGTTNSLVALVDGDRPRVIPDAEGRRLIPSVVSFKGDTILVGDEAKARKGEDVEHTLFSVKRLMGKGYDDVKDEIRYIPYVLSPDSREVVRSASTTGSSLRPRSRPTSCASSSARRRPPSESRSRGPSSPSPPTSTTPSARQRRTRERSPVWR